MTPASTEVTTQALYTVKQAALICWFSGTVELNKAIERGLVEPTLFPVETRNRRMFTREQLIWLLVYKILVDGGAKPGYASAAAKWCLEYVSGGGLHFNSPVEFLVFHPDERLLLPKFVLAGDALEKFRRELRFGGFVVDLRAVHEHIDRELQHLPHLNRYIELNPEKFGD